MSPRRPPDYRRAVLHHPAQVIAVIGATLVVFVIAGYGVPAVVPLVIALAVELVAIAFLPRLSLFRRSVDAHLSEKERRESAAARALLAAALRPEHRHELERLELVAEDIRAHGGVARLSEDWTGATELVDLFGRAALAYRARFETFGPDLGPALAEQRAAVMRRVLHAAGDVRAQLLRHLEVLRQRELAWASARCELDRLSVVQATINDQLRWMREQCALASSNALDAEIDIVLAGARESARVVRELPIDPERALVSRQRIALDEAPATAPSNALSASDHRNEELAFAAAAAGAASRVA
jgi:hypothetical protein